MTNFAKRILTGIVLILITLIAVEFSLYGFILFVLLINIFGLSEFYKLFCFYKPQKISGLILSICLILSFLSVMMALCDWRILLINVPLSFYIFIKELYSKFENPYQKLAFTFLGIIYITIPSIFLISIVFVSEVQNIYNPHILLGYFFIVWASDSGAYASGRIFGKHSLFKRISPHKTWEGSIGGAFSVLIISFMNSFLFKEIILTNWIIISFIVVIAGTYGDLIKSMMKRSLNVKDSGNILPGHGGILDRYDSLLGSSPFVFSYLLLITWN